MFFVSVMASSEIRSPSLEGGLGGRDGGAWVLFKSCSGEREMSWLSREELREWVERRGGGGGGMSLVASSWWLVGTATPSDVWNVSFLCGGCGLVVALVEVVVLVS